MSWAEEGREEGAIKIAHDREIILKRLKRVVVIVIIGLTNSNTM